MSDLFRLTNAQMARFEPFFLNSRDKRRRAFENVLGVFNEAGSGDGNACLIPKVPL